MVRDNVEAKKEQVTFQTLLANLWKDINDIAERKATEIMQQHLEDYEHAEKPTTSDYVREALEHASEK